MFPYHHLFAFLYTCQKQPKFILTLLRVLRHTLRMKNHVREAVVRRGLTPIEAHRRGMPYQSVYRQFRGQRKPSGEYAILYEKTLGIPRSEIRPDLWPPTESLSAKSGDDDAA